MQSWLTLFPAPSPGTSVGGVLVEIIDHILDTNVLPVGSIWSGTGEAAGVAFSTEVANLVRPGS